MDLRPLLVGTGIGLCIGTWFLPWPDLDGLILFGILLCLVLQAAWWVLAGSRRAGVAVLGVVAVPHFFLFIGVFSLLGLLLIGSAALVRPPIRRRDPASSAGVRHPW